MSGRAEYFPYQRKSAVTETGPIIIEQTKMKATTVITGCSSGCGKDLALKRARRGDRVYATMRGTEGKNAAVTAEFGVDVGVRERNAAVEPFDSAVLVAFGMSEFATLASGPSA